jgi:hypothetical protein
MVRERRQWLPPSSWRARIYAPCHQVCVARFPESSSTIRISGRTEAPSSPETATRKLSGGADSGRDGTRGRAARAASQTKARPPEDHRRRLRLAGPLRFLSHYSSPVDLSPLLYNPSHLNTARAFERQSNIRQHAPSLAEALSASSNNVSVEVPDPCPFGTSAMHPRMPGLPVVAAILEQLARHCPVPDAHRRQKGTPRASASLGVWPRQLHASTCRRT